MFCSRRNLGNKIMYKSAASMHTCHTWCRGTATLYPNSCRAELPFSGSVLQRVIRDNLAGESTGPDFERLGLSSNHDGHVKSDLSVGSGALGADSGAPRQTHNVM